MAQATAFQVISSHEKQLLIARRDILAWLLSSLTWTLDEAFACLETDHGKGTEGKLAPSRQKFANAAREMRELERQLKNLEVPTERQALLLYTQECTHHLRCIIQHYTWPRCCFHRQPVAQEALKNKLEVLRFQLRSLQPM